MHFRRSACNNVLYAMSMQIVNAQDQSFSLSSFMPVLYEVDNDKNDLQSLFVKC